MVKCWIVTPKTVSSSLTLRPVKCKLKINVMRNFFKLLASIIQGIFKFVGSILHTDSDKYNGLYLTEQLASKIQKAYTLTCMILFLILFSLDIILYNVNNLYYNIEFGIFLYLYIYLFIVFIFILFLTGFLNNNKFIYYLLFISNILSFIILLMLLKLYFHVNIKQETIIYFINDFLVITQKWDKNFLKEYAMGIAKELNIKDIDLEYFIEEYNTPEKLYIQLNKLKIIDKDSSFFSFLGKCYNYIQEIPIAYKIGISAGIVIVVGFVFYDINTIKYFINFLCSNTDYDFISDFVLPSNFDITDYTHNIPCKINRPNSFPSVLIFNSVTGDIARSLQSDFYLLDTIEEKNRILFKIFQDEKIMQECNDLTSKLVVFSNTCADPGLPERLLNELMKYPINYPSLPTNYINETEFINTYSVAGANAQLMRFFTLTGYFRDTINLEHLISYKNIHKVNLSYINEYMLAAKRIPESKF